jgi:hypothetical protein
MANLTQILIAWEFKKLFFVKMKISLGWLKQNIFKNQKCQAKNLNKIVFFLEVFIKNIVFSMLAMTI